MTFGSPLLAARTDVGNMVATFLVVAVAFSMIYAGHCVGSALRDRAAWITIVLVAAMSCAGGLLIFCAFLLAGVEFNWGGFAFCPFFCAIWFSTGAAQGRS